MKSLFYLLLLILTPFFFIDIEDVFDNDTKSVYNNDTKTYEFSEEALLN
jgi:hypothetical protein